MKYKFEDFDSELNLEKMKKEFHESLESDIGSEYEARFYVNDTLINLPEFKEKDRYPPPFLDSFIRYVKEFIPEY